MNALIIIDYFPIAKALQRFLHFVYNIQSDITDFFPLIKNGTSSFKDYKFVISDLYDKDSIGYGIHFAQTFEKRNIPIVYFFSNNYFKNGFGINDLPANCFYLPQQLSEFLSIIPQHKANLISYELLSKILNYKPLTSSHH